VARESLDPFRLHPGTAVADFGVAEDFRLRKLVLLILRGLVLVGAQRGEVDEPGDARVLAGVRDDRSAVGMTHEQNRAAHSPERADGRLDVGFHRVEAVLRRHYFVALGPQCRDELFEARAVSPDTVTKNDAWLAL